MLEVREEKVDQIRVKWEAMRESEGEIRKEWRVRGEVDLGVASIITRYDML